MRSDESARLHALGAELSALRAALRAAEAQKEDSLARLAGGIAHDLNNLLTPILAYASMGLMQRGPGEPLFEELDEIRQAAERATALLRQLQTFSRPQPLEIQPVALHRLIKGLAPTLRRLLGEGVALELQLAAGLGEALVDPARIEQILRALVVHAGDAIGDAGRVTIVTRELTLGPDGVELRPGMNPGPHVLLEVQDSGGGMSPAARSRVFEPFFTAREQSRGAGLDLAIVRGLVRQQGGDIRCDSEPGRGAVFRLLLPARRASPGRT